MANLLTQAEANTRPNHPVKKMRTNQKIEVVTLDTDTSEDERTTVEWSSSSSSSSSSEDEVQVIGTRKVARVSRQSFTSRRVDSNQVTRNYSRGNVTGNRNTGRDYGTSNSFSRRKDVNHVTRNGRDVTSLNRIGKGFGLGTSNGSRGK